MIFETKKVPLETLGEYLAEVRRQLGLSLTEVVEKTGIGDKYLLHLEAGQYHHLPPDVYVCGFLKKLAKIYAVPFETLLAQYKKERGIVDQVANNIITPATGWKARLSKLVITPKLISLAAGVGVVVIALCYMIFSVSAINQAPDLIVSEPSAGSIVKGSFVNVAGQTAPGTTLTINGQAVFVDTDGKFQTTLGVAAGQKDLEISAQNKFGKITKKNVLVVVEPTVVATEPVTGPAQEAALTLDLKFSRVTTFSVNRDGQELAEEVVAANAIKRIEAQNTIVLKTPDAGSVKATLNGKDLGVLGRSQEPLVIPFSADSVHVVKSPTGSITN